jgi:hypothetical protein
MDSIRQTAIRRPGRKLLCAALLILLLLGAPQPGGRAQSSGGAFTLVAHLVGGGTWSDGGDFSNGGAIGEPCVAVHHGGGYALYSGFLQGGATDRWPYGFYLPVVLRADDVSAGLSGRQ